MSKAYLSILIFAISFSGLSQNLPAIDSLYKVLQNEKSELKREYLKLEIAESLLSLSNYKSDSIAQSILGNNVALADIALHSKTLNLLARISFKERKDHQALIYSKAVDSLLEENNIENSTLVNSKFIQSEIAKFTFTEKGVVLSKQYLDEMLAISIAINSPEQIHKAYQAFGNYYGIMSEIKGDPKYLDSAIYYFKKALNFFISEEDTVNISGAYFNLASVATRKGDLKNSEVYHKKRVDILKNPKHLKLLCEAYATLAGFYYRRAKQFDKAITYYDSAGAVSKKIGYTDKGFRLGMLNGYALTFYELGKYKEAFEYLDKAYLLKDSLDRNKSREATIEYESKYQNEKKQAEIELLNAENRLAKKQNQNQFAILMSVAVVVFLLALFLYLLYRNRQKTTRKLQELDKIKSNFFANISHEFRTPLTLIKSPLDQQLASENLSAEERANLQMMQHSTNRLLVLVDQLLDLSKLESGNATLTPSLTPIVPFFKAIISPFYFPLEQAGITIETSFESAIETGGFDRDVVEKIVVNLLSNALKYTPKNGIVFFGLTG